MFLGRDLDDVLAYKTPHLVKIRDRKLCIGRLAIIGGVFGYVVIFAVIIQQGYLLREPPVGFIRMSMRDDANAAQGAYCGASSSSGLNYKTLPCAPWKYHESVFPAQEENSLMLSTRATITTTTSGVPGRDCFWGISACAPTTDNVTNYYVPGVEAYTLLLTHAVYGVQNDVHYIEREMKSGSVKDHDGNKLKDLAEDRKTGKNPYPGDFMTIQEILKFSGVDLESESASSKGETNRYSGVIILVYVKYRSSKVSLSDLKYSMRFIRIPGAEDKHEQTVYREVPNTSGTGTVSQRVVVNRHGIRLIVAQAGAVGKFSFQELLKTLVTALALIGVANFFVDKILLRLMPMRSVYEAYKYTMSVDFSEIKRDKVNNCYIANAKRNARGRPFALEAHDFVYGALLRGGKTGRPEWDYGEGPETAYRNCVIGHGNTVGGMQPKVSASCPSLHPIGAYPHPPIGVPGSPSMGMGTPTPTPHNGMQMPMLPMSQSEQIHIAGGVPAYSNPYASIQVPEPAFINPHPTSHSFPRM